MAQMLWFNKNRSCIEINFGGGKVKAIKSLIKTEVVLKQYRTKKLMNIEESLIKTEVVLKCSSQQIIR